VGERQEARPTVAAAAKRGSVAGASADRSKDRPLQKQERLAITKARKARRYMTLRLARGED
jgi:hypothetical protein